MTRWYLSLELNVKIVGLPNTQNWPRGWCLYLLRLHVRFWSYEWIGALQKLSLDLLLFLIALTLLIAYLLYSSILFLPTRHFPTIFRTGFNQIVPIQPTTNSHPKCHQFVDSSKCWSNSAMNTSGGGMINNPKRAPKERAFWIADPLHIDFPSLNLY